MASNGAADDTQRLASAASGSATPSSSAPPSTPAGTAAPSSSAQPERDDIVLGSAASAWQFNSRGDTVRAKGHGDDATSATSSSDDTGPDDSSVEIPSDTDDYKNEEAGYLPDLRGRGLYRAVGGTALPGTVPYARLASSSASDSPGHADSSDTDVPPLVNSGTTELASTTDTAAPAHSGAEVDACAHGDDVAAKPSEPEDTQTIAVAAAH